MRIQIRTIHPKELNDELLRSFQRTQKVSVCLRKGERGWRLADVVFTEEWDAAAKRQVTEDLQQISTDGGSVWGAFDGDRLLGFAAVAPQRLGRNQDMIALQQLHVSADMRRRGVGHWLFEQAVALGRMTGARKLYISAHSSLESQAFYDALGCTEAWEYDPSHVELEPCDCQLEYRLLPQSAYEEPLLPSPLAAARQASLPVPLQ